MILSICKATISLIYPKHINFYLTEIPHKFALRTYFLYQWNVKTKKKVYYMSLETEVTKGFVVNLQLLCFYGDLREKKSY